jgi:hypothetical protein
MVLCTQTTLGNLSTHLPFGSPTRHFDIPMHIIPFARSTAQFDCGCFTDMKHN